MSRWIALLWLAGPSLLGAESNLDRFTREGVAKFTAAYQAWDGSQFADAADLFSQATTEATASSTNFYWLGTAHFHHLLQLQSQAANPVGTRAAAAAMDAALAALERAAELNPRDPETHALLGTIYGMKIDGNLIRAVRFGPRVAEHRRRALEFGANNARAQYLLGMCLFHTAKRAADEREALATLLRAERLFEAEVGIPAGPFEPRWGYATCMTFIGRSYERLGDRVAAARYYGRALERHPADHLARDGLSRVSDGQ